ncbi:nuclease-related domain-containing protein [Mammaliicoccus stepanovicii]|uniref:Nuclease-related domain n=1 Tax=Mammaliicoccus stepanovicii TaxID=643214 RepID=A0A239ZSY3_9STAP|nr:nuclease-related domain-containing protein [Mammaliicoccus stepanovicii]PNZ77518.1 NERD domain-containing protein [Mammaliicoccus stepanovicii]GGI38903.1 hypothetical protein GCM10010896_00710 [Mammaliicoccus stepanovicii]SNV74362.1 Nuclease-related domain [Mammaliicoccus stepanovicii]
MKLHKPLLLFYLEALNGRIDMIPIKLEEQYKILKTGYEGEQKFANILNLYHTKWCIHDVQLKNCNQVQFDFIVVTDEEILQFEIKNYTGDYYYENHKLFRSSGYVSKDLLNQIEVSDNALRRIVSRYRFNREVKSYIVFVNPTFTLFGDLRSRINLLLNSELYKIQDMVSSNFKYDENKAIYETIKKLHEPFMQNLIQFERVSFEKIRKGIKCTNCQKLIKTDLLYNARIWIECSTCKTNILKHELIIYALKELYILKGKPFSVSEAVEWTGVSKTSLKRLLYKEFERVGKCKNTKYYYKINE